MFLFSALLLANFADSPSRLHKGLLSRPTLRRPTPIATTRLRFNVRLGPGVSKSREKALPAHSGEIDLAQGSHPLPIHHLGYTTHSVGTCQLPKGRCR